MGGRKLQSHMLEIGIRVVHKHESCSMFKRSLIGSRDASQALHRVTFGYRAQAILAPIPKRSSEPSQRKERGIYAKLPNPLAYYS
jgi:hypothetical protein